MAHPLRAPSSADCRRAVNAACRRDIEDSPDWHTLTAYPQINDHFRTDTATTRRAEPWTEHGADPSSHHADTEATGDVVGTQTATHRRDLTRGAHTRAAHRLESTAARGAQSSSTTRAIAADRTTTPSRTWEYWAPPSFQLANRSPRLHLPARKAQAHGRRTGFSRAPAGSIRSRPGSFSRSLRRAVIHLGPQWLEWLLDQI